MKKRCKFIKIVSGLLKQLNCPRFLHNFGPKKYEFKHHLSGLMLKEIMKTSFRRVVEILDLFGVRVPSYSALCKSRKRIPAWIWHQLLTITAGVQHNIAAIDSTGFSTSNPSLHYIKRIDRENAVRYYAKTSMLFGVDKRKVIAVHVRVKPAHDVRDIKTLLRKFRGMQHLLADKAYDVEWLHEWCFWKGIQTFIPSKKNTRRGFFRKKQKKAFTDEDYHQRSLIESGFSAIKRKYGGAVSGKSLASINSEINCKALAHNLRLS